MKGENSNRRKKLAKNILLFTISSIGTKLIYFFLLPLYTSYLSAKDYGTVDLINTVLSLILPVLTIGMIDSVLRYSIVQKDKKESVLDNALIILFIDICILGVGCCIVDYFNIVCIDSYYYIFFITSFLLTSLYQVLCNYYRGLNHVKEIMIAGIMNAGITCLCNILFLVYFQLGVFGYLLSILLGLLSSDFFLIMEMFRKNIYYLKRRKINRILFGDMINYGFPLILNGISWWINNSLDRIIIIGILGTAANGIYAISYKIPSILSIFQTIFNQAWTMTAIQEMNSSDKDSIYSKMYALYEAGMFLICSLLILLNMFFADLLYGEDFFAAWHYTLPLIIAALAGAMGIFLSSVFCAVGESKTVGITTFIGAAVNLILNIIFIPRIGLLGAAIATVISNIVIWIIRLWRSITYVKIKSKPYRELVCFFLICIQGVLAYQELHFYYWQILIFIVLILLFKDEIFFYLEMFSKILVSKRKKRKEVN